MAERVNELVSIDFDKMMEIDAAKPISFEEMMSLSAGEPAPVHQEAERIDTAAIDISTFESLLGIVPVTATDATHIQEVVEDEVPQPVEDEVPQPLVLEVEIPASVPAPIPVAVEEETLLEDDEIQADVDESASTFMEDMEPEVPTLLLDLDHEPMRVEAKLPMIILSEEEIYEPASGTVLRLRESDLRLSYRGEAGDDFFADHGIRCDEQGIAILGEEHIAEYVHRNVVFLCEEDIYQLSPDGVIRLREEDLLEFQRIAEESTSKIGRKKVGGKRARSAYPVVSSGLSDHKIRAYALYVLIFFSIASIFSFHFKFTWEKLTPQAYEHAKEDASGFSSFTLPLLKRTGDEWYNFFGRQKINAGDYEKAAESWYFLTWLHYSHSGRADWPSSDPKFNQ